MDTLITGEIEHTIDSSNRLFVSKKLRDRAFADEAGTAAYLVPSADGVLSLYTEQAYKDYVTCLSATETGDTAMFERFMYALATPCELDKTGRIQLTDKIRKRYNLSDNLTIIGVRDHLEIWNTDDWEDYLRKNFKHFNRQARTARSRTFDSERDSEKALAGAAKKDEG